VVTQQQRRADICREKWALHATALKGEKANHRPNHLSSMELAVGGLNRRAFVRMAGTAGLFGATSQAEAKRRQRASHSSPENTISIPDDGWRLWVDDKAAWQDDAIHLPDDVKLDVLPINAPTGGWDALTAAAGIAVTLPSTVEQHAWGKFGSRQYTLDEFTYANSDPDPKNGAYVGVSWWWRAIDIPANWRGRRIILNVRGARLRAEVYLNRKLVGYSIIEELPFECDLTAAANPGGVNVLAIRITNPGGRYDWVDSDVITWGKVKIPRSHGFGGLDRGLTLSGHPMGSHIRDAWVLNTPKRNVVSAFLTVQFASAPDAAAVKAMQKWLALEIADVESGRALATHIRFDGVKLSGNDATYRFTISAPKAKVWDLATPRLYRLRAHWTAPQGGTSTRTATYGFRWFTPDGIGKDAVFRLNGRRIRLYSAISWGYWGLNGLWPTPDLAEKEVTQAKILGLNCLAFHRNPGKRDVLDAQDRLGLLRGMEPGGGKFAIGKWPDGVSVDAHSVVMQPPTTEADRFTRDFALAKIRAMMRTFRSHPSLIHWTLQNEIGANFNDPATVAALEAMRAEDESRTILMNDGMSSPEIHAAQAWFAPYDPNLHRSDKEPWGSWWDDHQGAGDQWYDEFYRDPERFTYRNTIRPQLVEYGEMEGCAVPDNHTLMVADILQRGGASYDLTDHKEILAAYQAFLDRWGFRPAFPTAETLFLEIGRKSYASWQQYLENARINDATDYAVISGWESTAIDNHSGIVDNLRNFKSDPALIRSSLLPVRPVAKQRALVIAEGEHAMFDLFLVNDTGHAATGRMRFAMTDPAGEKTILAEFVAPFLHRDQMSAMVKDGVSTPPLTLEGLYRFEFSLSSTPAATQVRELWVVDAKRPPLAGKTLRIAVTGVWPRLRAQLEALPGISVEEFSPGNRFDAIICSGLTEQSTAAQKLGGDEGLTLQKQDKSTPSPGFLPSDVLATVKAGTPMLLLPQEDGLADGLATQLAAEGALTYRGLVGRYRAPWMGNWYFLRTHPVYAGMPADCAMAGFFQVRGRQANGLLVDGANVDVFVGYSRDHDRRVGAGTFTTKLGAGKVVFQRVPDLIAPMQQRFLSNALNWLCA
jgi:hypothetical protein